MHRQALLHPKQTLKRLETAAWAVVCGFALLNAWIARHTVDADGLSYLDIADAILRGDWKNVVNAYWSPLYPLLLLPAVAAGRAWPYWEAAAAHAVNLAIFFGALIAFRMLLREAAANARCSSAGGPGEKYLPTDVYTFIASALFMWTSLEWTSVRRTTPDILVSALVYLTGVFLIKRREERHNRRYSILLGFALALGYYAKTVFFPLAVALLVVLIAVEIRQRRRAVNAIAAALAFFALSGPWVLALSLSKGRFTFGDSGLLNYAWYVNGVCLHVHWQGDPPGFGHPLHPTKQLSTHPKIYAFASPIGGTYPPWFDPSYWYEGVRPRFIPAQQMARSAHNLITLLLAAVPILLAAVAMAATRNWSWRIDCEALRNQWPLLFLAALGLVSYLLVLVQRRYIAPFSMLFWICLLSSVRVRETGRSEAASWKIASAVVVPIFVFVAGSALHQLQRAASDQLREGPHPHWTAAQALMHLGVKEGSLVAYLGYGAESYWARLAHVRIVAEAYDGTADRDKKHNFSSAGRTEELVTRDGSLRRRVKDLFLKTGAVAVVSRNVPSFVAQKGWHRLGRTHYYAYLLR